MVYNVVLASLGEVAVKGKQTRSRMQRALVASAAEALRKWGVREFQIEIQEGKIVVQVSEDVERAAVALAHVFGLEKVAPAHKFAFSTLEEVAERVASIFGSAVKGKRFRVTARRVGVSGFTSQDIMREVGAALAAAGGIVSLKDYEVEVVVEVRGQTAYAYDVSLPGAGGLPEGVEGKVLSLISGGFDSPVAAYLLMKRGASVDFAFFNIGGEEQRAVALEAACALSCLYSHRRRQVLWDVEFRWVFPLMSEVPERLRGVYLKRAMYLAAERIAMLGGYKALATGESLAQVSSQTLQNLVSAEQGISLPILRPLIGLDKKEIVKKSMEIGTYSISSKAKEFCALATPHPSTRVKPEELNHYVEKTRLLETLEAMVPAYAEKVDLASRCECSAVINQRYKELKNRLETLSPLLRATSAKRYSLQEHGA